MPRTQAPTNSAVAVFDQKAAATKLVTALDERRDQMASFLMTDE